MQPRPQLPGQLFRVFEVDFDVAPPGDFQRVVEGLRTIREKLPHLGGAFEKYVFWINHPVWVVCFFARAYRAEAVMGLVVIFREEMHVVCRDDACADFIRQVNQRFGDIGVVTFVALDFDEVSFGAEDFEVSFGNCLAAFISPPDICIASSPFGQAEVTISPSLSSARICLSIRGGSKTPQCNPSMRALGGFDSRRYFERARR